MGVILLPSLGYYKEINELDKLQDVLDCYRYQTLDEGLIFLCGQEVNNLFDYWFSCGYLFEVQYPLLSVDEVSSSINIDLSYLEELVVPKHRHLFGFEEEEE